MKIFNVRLGLANNSSSSHSLIFQQGAHDDYDGQRFGWDFFTCASSEAKSEYLGQTLYHSLLRMCSEEMAVSVVRDWMGVTVDTDGYVDHQSCYEMPSNWEGNGIDKQFFDEFRAFLMRDDLVILGGNDNTDEKHPLDDGTAFTLPFAEVDPLVARKDGDYWTLFNRETGGKIRVAFDDKVVEPKKSRAPELVDIKITDYCPYGCPACYMASTTKGQIADKSFLNDAIYALSQMQVFEVALGGGEPTLSPDFVEILSSCRSHGIVPNFTTKNLRWLSNQVEAKEILSLAGSFAYSADDATHVAKIAHLADLYDLGNRVTIQYVMGLESRYGFEDMLRRCEEHYLRLTLLGYKPIGRGSTFKPHDYSTWFESVKKMADQHKCPSLSIDTLLAQQWLPSLVAAGVPKWLYHLEEGKFSMYIDAVDKVCGPSSYDGPRIPLKDGYHMDEELLRAYATF